MLVLNSSAYAVAYCPQVITCDRRSCTELPKDFYISAGRPKSNATYYFSHAMDGSRVGLGNSTCAYGEIAISRNILRADIGYSGNQWKPTLQEGIFVCRYNSDTCPFK